ncbi:hypothetical protein OG874_29590 [Nocardia sp. NBC_00565]|uniref:hypothetical protein n=1 Tax=Nocardia sp. NBC_00565 TaxID=2975993 RepID=UPI002E7FDF85|nr:hypothetical protein [Nocardia sp. NBC_00565]WUC00965.1 hypothetical protein OG874_29590 [Nocardia sp. NBC_00565]
MSEPGNTAALYTGMRRNRSQSAAPLWPGMIAPAAAPRVLPAPRPPRKRRHPPRPPWLVGTAALFGTMAAVALVLVYTAAASNTRQATATITDPVLGGGPNCEPMRSEQLVRGNGTGSTKSGPDVILAFQYAYYVTRSGADARTLTSPDAGVAAVALIDAGIKSIPPGTQHCVLITPMADGRFDVVITEIRADSTVRTYRQFVSVAPREGIIVITKITPPS